MCCVVRGARIIITAKVEKEHLPLWKFPDSDFSSLR
jgi:hypothetical protein